MKDATFEHDYINANAELHQTFRLEKVNLEVKKVNYVFFLAKI